MEKRTRSHGSACSGDLPGTQGPGAHKYELDGVLGFPLASWETYDHSFIHLFGQQKPQGTDYVLGAEDTEGTPHSCSKKSPQLKKLTSSDRGHSR